MAASGDLTALAQTRDRALAWLSHSPIRRADDPLSAGGVHRGLDRQRGLYDYLYSEITGYAVSTHVCAWRWTGDRSHLALAESSAACLLRLQERFATEAAPGAILQGLAQPDLSPMARYYSFDNAMCIQGLMDLHAVNGDETLASAARKAARWLAADMQQADGSFLALHDADTGRRHHPGDEFFDDHGALHAKHAIGLLKVWRATGDEDSLSAARRVCDWVLTLQDATGGFRANPRTSEVVTHAHCYAAEGLLYAGSVLDEPRWTAAARRGAEWLLAHQHADGWVPIAHEPRWWALRRRASQWWRPVAVADATSQAARLWLAIAAGADVPAFVTAAGRACRFLSSLQCAGTGDARIDGGFPYAPGHAMLFAWPAMFAAQACAFAGAAPVADPLGELF